MAIGKIASSLIKKIGAEVVAPEATKQFIKTPIKRTLAKNVPEGKIFEDVRVKDINKEKQSSLGNISQLKKTADQRKKLIEKQKILVDKRKIKAEKTTEEADIKKLEISSKRLETSKDKIELINNKKRDLHLKLIDLKLEQQLTENYTKLKNTSDPFRAIKDITSEISGVGQPLSKPNTRAKVIYNRFSQDLFELKDELRTKFAGLSQNKELGDDFIRSLKDGYAGNPMASKIAKQWKLAANKAITMRNKAGGKKRKLEDWVMPQSHPARVLRRMGKEKWKELIINKLDKTRIEAEQGGKLDDILENAYKNIIAIQVEKSVTKNTLAKQQEFERILHFKDGESIIKYNDAVGNNDVFNIIDNYLKRQSKEIALMQLYGSRPDAMFEKLLELGRNDGLGKTVKGEDALRRIWNVTTEKINESDAVSKVDGIFQSISEGFRSLAVSSKLGTASISSIADIGTIVVGSGYRGLNSITILGKGFQTMLQESVSWTKTGFNHELANRLGISSEFAQAALSNAKYAEHEGAGWLAKRAENVIRASGLGAWTDSLRTGFGLDLASNLFDNFEKDLNKVNFKDMLIEYGINKEEWDIIRSTNPKELQIDKFKGKYLNLEEVFRKDEKVGYMLSEMIQNEMDAFIISPDARVRAWSTAGAKRGTLKGEGARSLMLFRSFPTSILMLHAHRWQKLGKSGKVAYAAGTIFSGIVTGSVALWAYDLVTGYTPRDWKRKEMIPEALLKSGALGVFADFVSGAKENRYGQNILTVLGGVPASTAVDLGNTFKDILNLKKETPANAYNRAKQYIPGQNLWYTRLAMEYTLGELVGNIVDPNRQKKKRRREKFIRKRGQKRIEF